MGAEVEEVGVVVKSRADDVADLCCNYVITITISVIVSKDYHLQIH